MSLLRLLLLHHHHHTKKRGCGSGANPHNLSGDEPRGRLLIGRDALHLNNIFGNAPTWSSADSFFIKYSRSERRWVEGMWMEPGRTGFERKKERKRNEKGEDEVFTNGLRTFVFRSFLLSILRTCDCSFVNVNNYVVYNFVHNIKKKKPAAFKSHTKFHFQKQHSFKFSNETGAI